ncbi:hypothetical protein ACSAMQ_13575, partial [Lysobacter sp. 1R34A]
AAAQAAAAMREMGGGRQAAPSFESGKAPAPEAPVQAARPRPNPALESAAAPVAKPEPMPVAAAPSEPAPRMTQAAVKPAVDTEPQTRVPLTWPDEELAPKPNLQRVAERTEAPVRAAPVERAAAPESVEPRSQAAAAMPPQAAAEPVRETAPPSPDPGPSLFGSPGPDSEPLLAAPRVEPVSVPAAPAAAPARPSEPITMPARAASPSGGIADDEAWHALVDASGLRGPARILAEHASFVAYGDGVLTLSLPADDDHLRAPALIKMVADALATRLGAAPQIRFEAASAAGESLHARNLRARDERQAMAEERFMNDPDVRRLIEIHGAKVVPDSIRPYDET